MRRASLGGSAIRLLLAIFELLVERTHAADALLGVLFTLKLKAHADLFELGTLESECVAALRLAIQLVYDLIVFQHGLVIVTLLRDPVVEGNYLRGRLPARDLDQVVHVEPALQDGMR